MAHNCLLQRAACFVIHVMHHTFPCDFLSFILLRYFSSPSVSLSSDFLAPHSHFLLAKLSLPLSKASTKKNPKKTKNCQTVNLIC